MILCLIPAHDFEHRVEHALLRCEDSVGHICVSVFVFCVLWARLGWLQKTWFGLWEFQLISCSVLNQSISMCPICSFRQGVLARWDRISCDLVNGISNLFWEVIHLPGLVLSQLLQLKFSIVGTFSYICPKCFVWVCIQTIVEYVLVSNSNLWCALKTYMPTHAAD